MSLKLFSSISVANADPKIIGDTAIPSDLEPWVSKCTGCCLLKPNRLSNHEVCLYRIAKDKYYPRLSHRASGLGRIDYLEYCFKNNHVFGIYDAENAAREGHLDCLKYLFEHGCRFDDWSHYAAARNGHLDCLEYIDKNVIIGNLDTMECAAINGHLACIQYLHERGCPWDESVSSAAAHSGNFECFKYTVDNGCPLDVRISILLDDMSITAEIRGFLRNLLDR